MTDVAELEERIRSGLRGDGAVDRQAVASLLDALESGEVRAATPDPGEPHGWRVRGWVKEGILAAFSLEGEREFSAGPFRFRDREALPPRSYLPSGARVVPGGTAVRRGAYLGDDVVVMPPAYVNVGAHVDDGAMVDSHALVGSCGQVGRRVHLSAAAQVGGVLEPVQSLPVILEDDVFVGGGVGLYEGVVVRRAAVLAAGVTLTGSSRVYDLVEERMIRADPESGQPLVVPEGAVVVPGSRSLEGEFARRHGLSLDAPVVVKRRDASTDASTALEEALR